MSMFLERVVQTETPSQIAIFAWQSLATLYITLEMLLSSGHSVVDSHYNYLMFYPSIMCRNIITITYHRNHYIIIIC